MGELAVGVHRHDGDVDERGGRCDGGSGRLRRRRRRIGGVTARGKDDEEVAHHPSIDDNAPMNWFRCNLDAAWCVAGIVV
jgi:hypothetical protein